jgi:DnaJ-class molecular chaperone
LRIRILILLAATLVAMAKEASVVVCPSCKGEGGFGVRGGVGGLAWSTCWTCKGNKVIAK